MFEEYIESKKNEIINNLIKLISFKSISTTNINSPFPFGMECSNCLHYVLDLAKSMGFKTKNVDEYCGYIEFGEGEELIGIVGHLDVVPANDGWKHDPFNADISEGKLYGRGSVDDKGPVIASLYAMKAVMDNYKINKRVRLILGLNEEQNWKCIKYYKEHEEIPTFGFSPDANFPVIFAEKGILSSWFESDYNNSSIIKILSIDCNNNPFNVVPKICKIDLELSSIINKRVFIEKIHLSNKKYNFNIEINELSINKVQIVLNGEASHSAHPELGSNAISKLIIVLNELFNSYNCNCNIFQFFSDKINTELSGKSLGIDFKDESGSLTLNVAKFLFEDNKIKIGMNLRIPVTIKISEIEDKLKKEAEKYTVLSYSHSSMDPLHLSLENDLVKKLLDIYNQKTNSQEKPIAIGGGTFARAFDNFVSFGPTFPGDSDLCHQNDEYIEIEKLLLCANIYADAIYELCNDLH